MATRFYSRSDVPSDNAPTADSKSVALPIGTNNPGGGLNDNDSLLLTAGTADVSTNITSLAQTARQSGRFSRATSLPLAAQTISANTWTAVVRVQESNTNANAFAAFSIFVWRPSTSSRVGFIYDSSTSLGTEWGTTLSNRTYTVSGSAVTVEDGDVLSWEIWYSAAQSASKSYTLTIQERLTTYLETPQNLTFFTAPKERSFGWVIP